MPTTQRSDSTALLPIFLTVLIDMLGVGVIIPVIPPLIMSNSAGLLSSTWSSLDRSILYSALIACYPVMQFFGAPMLGALSDRYGRKPILTISLLGTAAGYLLFAIAIVSKNIPLLFFSRMLPGFMGGNIAIIQSSISDISDEESKTRKFGIVGAAFGLGFILGPTLGGILSDPTVVPWFNAATPFWFTAGLTLFNTTLVQIIFRETLSQKHLRAINPFTGLRNVATAFSIPRLRAIFVSVLLLSLGFTFFTQFFSVYLIDRFQFAAKDIGLLYGWVGVWLVLTQAVIVRRLSRQYRPVQVINISLLMMGITVGLLVLPQESYWFYFINPLIAIFNGCTSPNMTATVSSLADRREQGKILGINQSMLALGQVIPPLIGGFLSYSDTRYPLLASCALLIASWLVFKGSQP